MSAIAAADRLHGHPLAPAGTASETRDAGGPPPEQLSPELALVDPALARRARALLPDPVAAPNATAAPWPPSEAVPATSAREPASRPRLAGKPVLGATSCLLAALAVAVTWVRSGDRASPQTAASAASSQRPAPAASSPTPAAVPASAAETRTAERQTFVWAPVAGAAGYEFQLFRGSERLLRARVDETRLQLPGELPGGEPGTLGPGTYRWYVWAIRQRTGSRESPAVVQARLTIENESR